MTTAPTNEAKEIENYFKLQAEKFEALQAKLTETEMELKEQCRINGMGAQRELKLETELARVRLELAESKRVEKKLDDMHEAEKDKVFVLNGKLERAEKVVEFYADKKNWWQMDVSHKQTADTEYPGIIIEADITKDDFITDGEYKQSGGKLAREYLKKERA